MRILIGAKHELFREGLKSILSREFTGSEFLMVENMADLVNQVVKSGHIDLVMADEDVFCLDDCDLVEALTILVPSSRIMVISHDPSPSRTLSFFEKGVHGVLPPTSTAAITRIAIDMVMAGSTYIPSSLLTPMPSMSYDITQPDFRAPAFGSDTQQEVKLTTRQKQVAELMCQGRSNKEIAHTLNIAEGTVKIHISALFRLHESRNRTHLVLQMTRQLSSMKQAA